MILVTPMVMIIVTDMGNAIGPVTETVDRVLNAIGPVTETVVLTAIRNLLSLLRLHCTAFTIGRQEPTQRENCSTRFCSVGSHIAYWHII